MKISGKNNRVPKKKVVVAGVFSIKMNNKDKCTAYDTI